MLYSFHNLWGADVPSWDPGDRPLGGEIRPTDKSPESSGRGGSFMEIWRDWQVWHDVTLSLEDLNDALVYFFSRQNPSPDSIRLRG
jgi:hypothetical protein